MTGGGGQTSYICFNAGGRSADDDGVTSSDLAVLTQSPRDKYLLRDCGGAARTGRREGSKCAGRRRRTASMLSMDKVALVNGRVRLKILPSEADRVT